MTSDDGSDREHEMLQSFPDFLRQLDRDPELAWSGFHVFAWKLLSAHPPLVFRDLPREGREEIISDIVLACRADNFRLLRGYEDRGVPFAAWVARLARNRALDRMRHDEVVDRHRDSVTRIAARPLSEPADEAVDNRQLLDAVREAIRRLGVRCRLLIEAAADELKPAEIAHLLGNPIDDNKKISDALRACRRTLRQMLRRHGLEFEGGGMTGRQR
ncbi:MAG TPA: sigma-70 family RNA polymerase sigma factor [Candidatus Eisenbacteria bacterium]